jgi:membrane-associated phospholipid phosphatase
LTGADKTDPASARQTGGISWAWIAPALLALALALWLQLRAPQVELFLAINRWSGQFPVAFWSFATLLGEADVLFCLLSPLLLWRPQMIVAVLAAVPLGGLLSVTLKSLFQASRPASVVDPAQFNLIGIALGNASFPSGHTITAFAAALALVLVRVADGSGAAQRKAGSSAPLFAALALMLATLIGLSRVAVGAHWPVDVLAGAACGWLAGCSGAWLSARFPGIWRSELSQFVIGQLFLLTGLWLLFKTPAYPAGVLAIWLAVACVLATVIGLFLKMRKHLRQATQANAQARTQNKTQAGG